MPPPPSPLKITRVDFVKDFVKDKKNNNKNNNNHLRYLQLELILFLWFISRSLIAPCPAPFSLPSVSFSSIFHPIFTVIDDERLNYKRQTMVFDIFRRVGPREGEVQVYHRRFGPDFLRTFGILELSTLLLLLPITLGCTQQGKQVLSLFTFILTCRMNGNATGCALFRIRIRAPFISTLRTNQHSTNLDFFRFLDSLRWMHWLPRSTIFQHPHFLFFFFVSNWNVYWHWY